MSQHFIRSQQASRAERKTVNVRVADNFLRHRPDQDHGPARRASHLPLSPTSERERRSAHGRVVEDSSPPADFFNSEGRQPPPPLFFFFFFLKK